MKVMILAAGRGERMKSLTDYTPKPLLHVRDKALIIWQIEKLAKSGFREIIINVAYFGYKIMQTLGDGSKWGVEITYSDEQSEGALESGGGIIKALPLLGSKTFLVVNADVWSDYRFERSFNLGDNLAHLILVPNPEHNPKGDFALENTKILNDGEKKFTFSGIGYYSPKLFENLQYKRLALAPILRDAISKNRVSGALHVSEWYDIGTPQRLEFINKILDD